MTDGMCIGLLDEGLNNTVSVFPCGTSNERRAFYSLWRVVSRAWVSALRIGLTDSLD